MKSHPLYKIQIKIAIIYTFFFLRLFLSEANTLRTRKARKTFFRVKPQGSTVGNFMCCKSKIWSKTKGNRYNLKIDSAFIKINE